MVLRCSTGIVPQAQMFWPDDKKWYLIQIDSVDPRTRKAQCAFFLPLALCLERIAPIVFGSFILASLYNRSKWMSPSSVGCPDCGSWQRLPAGFFLTPGQ